MSSALHSRRSGCGEPLVLLHGWGMNLQVFEGLRARLAPHYTVIALDLPGHGRSSWSDGAGNAGDTGDGSVDSGAAALERIAAAIPPGAPLLGWSLGGQIALELAQRCAARRLVLIASTPRFVRAEDWTCGLAPQAVQRFAATLSTDAGIAMAEFLELQSRGSPPAAEVRSQLQQALERGGPAHPAALRWGLERLRQTDLRERARRLETPLLVVCGRHDAVMPGAGAALAALVPRARLLQLARAGHAPFLCHPEEVASAMLQFLGAEAPESAR